jgi:hypothetical protein
MHVNGVRKFTTGRSMRRTLFVALLGAAAVGMVAGVALGGGSSDEPRPRIGGWPEDVNGDGIISDSGSERIPELIQAGGDDGVLGYVRYEDLEGPQPSNPSEALEMSGDKRTIALYAEDGTTVIGQYTIKGVSGPMPSLPPPVDGGSGK